MSNKLSVVEHVNGTSLEVYRDRQEVRELANRLLALHPAAKEVGEGGMLAVAQLAVAIGASPLPGTNEIHVWRNGGRIQFQLGVNYFRRKAREFGGVLWQVSPRQMNDAERKAYGVPQGQIGAIARGVRAADMEKYITMGFRPNDIWEMVGYTGVAVCGPNEAKAGRPAAWTAMKRAEVDAYRGLFPEMNQQVGAAGAQIGHDISSEPADDVIMTDEDLDAWNVDMFDVHDDREPAPAPEPEEVTWEELPSEGEARGMVPRDAETVRAELSAAAAANENPASEAQLKYVRSSLSSATENGAQAKAIIRYLTGLDSSKDLTAGWASAMIDWLGANLENKYTVSDVAVQECARIYTAALKDEGQQALL